MTKTATFRPNQKVTIEIDGERFGATLTHEVDADGFTFARLADGTYTGKISATRVQVAVVLRHNDYIRVTDALRAKNHSVTTLSGYGHGYGDYDGIHGLARYTKALERNDGKAVWISAEATVISAYYERPKPRQDVASGDLIWFDSAAPGEGGWYRLTLPGHRYGDHCQLVRA